MARLLYGRDQSVTTYHRGIHLLLPSLDDSCQGCYLPGIVLGAENWSRPRWRWGWQRRYSDSTWTWSWETPFYPYSSYQSWALEIQDPQGYTSFLTYRILMRWLWPLSLRVKRMKSTLNKKKKKKGTGSILTKVKCHLSVRQEPKWVFLQQTILLPNLW